MSEQTVTSVQPQERQPHRGLRPEEQRAIGSYRFANRLGHLCCLPNHANQYPRSALVPLCLLDARSRLSPFAGQGGCSAERWHRSKKSGMKGEAERSRTGTWHSEDPPDARLACPSEVLAQDGSASDSHLMRAHPVSWRLQRAGTFALGGDIPRRCGGLQLRALAVCQIADVGPSQPC